MKLADSNSKLSRKLEKFFGEEIEINATGEEISSPNPEELKKQFERAKKEETANRLPAVKERALSLTHLRYIKQANWKLKLILFICTGIFFGLNWKFPQMNLSLLPFILLAFIILLIIKEQLLEYRIRKGLFGTNRTEARALIEFIIKNSDDIDFTDSNGKLRRALLPKAEPATTEQTLPAFGEEASA